MSKEKIRELKTLRVEAKKDYRAGKKALRLRYREEKKQLTGQIKEVKKQLKLQKKAKKSGTPSSPGILSKCEHAFDEATLRTADQLSTKAALIHLKRSNPEAYKASKIIMATKPYVEYFEGRRERNKPIRKRDIKAIKKFSGLLEDAADSSDGAIHEEAKDLLERLNGFTDQPEEMKTAMEFLNAFEEALDVKLARATSPI